MKCQSENFSEKFYQNEKKALAENEKMFCEYCGKEIDVLGSRSFCSHKCRERVNLLKEFLKLKDRLGELDRLDKKYIKENKELLKSGRNFKWNL